MTSPEPQSSFRLWYSALTDQPAPFHWQERLFLCFLSGEIPPLVSIPTGCGKTAAIVIWLLALAHQARRADQTITLPRRLVWVVNRRVVVDQATKEAAKLRQKLRDRSIRELDAVRQGLATLATDSTELPALSTLRGELADNAEWREDPARPAIIVGTVDMIGSRLLFNAYGRGYRSRPLHAAYLGQDALIAHDEAHLEPAFHELLRAVEMEQRASGDLRPLRVMALTATGRVDDATAFTLLESEITGEIQRRVEAKKKIAFHPVPDEKAIAGKVTDLAIQLKDSGQAILIFLRRVEDVLKTAEELRRARLKTETLTGTLRGYERDDLAKSNSIFARFLRNPETEVEDGTVFLVCTSAGEVGVDMSGDHLICDLTPFDSMAQRLGRVNRFGEGEAKVEVVHIAQNEGAGEAARGQSSFELACQRTLELLTLLSREADERMDGCPLALMGLPEDARFRAYAPRPAAPPATDVLFDMWALTTFRGKLAGRPPVVRWLHGEADWQPPETHVAWRSEVELIPDEVLKLHEPEDLLDDYPLKPHELLRDVTDRVKKQIQKIAGRHQALRIWVIRPDGSVNVEDIRTIIDKRHELADCTIVLPPAAGGLRKGMLDGDAEFEEGEKYDVSGLWLDEDGAPRRCRVWSGEEVPGGMRLVRAIDLVQAEEEDLESPEDNAGGRRWCWYVRPHSADDEGSRSAAKEQDLEEHLSQTQELARRMTSKLNLAGDESSAVALACLWHDLGKSRAIWQRSIGNTDAHRVLAKAAGRMMPERLSKYRHEFGSLMDVQGLPEFQNLKPHVQDLVLHLISAHHGRARPHFPDEEAFDPEYREQEAMTAAREAPRRYARLQRRYGRWGLAYLESLVRSVDATISRADSAILELLKEADAAENGRRQ